MASKPRFGSSDGNEGVVMLNVLSAVERNSNLTQRNLSSDLGIALGLANSYLRRCVRKGLIKIGQVPLNRYAYYLTPRGLAEKSRLSFEYLTWSFEFFRRARKQCSDLFGRCIASGGRRVVLFGTSELAEIAILSMVGTPIEIVAVVDPHATSGQCAGRPVVATMAAAKKLAGRARIDALMITDMRDPYSTYQNVIAIAKAERLPRDLVLVPDLLQLSQRPKVRAAKTNGRRARASGGR